MYQIFVGYIKKTAWSLVFLSGLLHGLTVHATEYTAPGVALNQAVIEVANDYTVQDLTTPTEQGTQEIPIEEIKTHEIGWLTEKNTILPKTSDINQLYHRLGWLLVCVSGIIFWRNKNCRMEKIRNEKNVDM